MFLILGIIVGVILGLYLKRKVTAGEMKLSTVAVVTLVLLAGAVGALLYADKKDSKEFVQGFKVACEGTCSKRWEADRCTEYCRCALSAVLDGRKTSELAKIWTRTGRQLDKLPEREQTLFKNAVDTCY